MSLSEPNKPTAQGPLVAAPSFPYILHMQGQSPRVDPLESLHISQSLRIVFHQPFTLQASLLKSSFRDGFAHDIFIYLINKFFFYEIAR